jgi:predicted DNA-binding transcriptional regulator AlpA
VFKLMRLLLILAFWMVLAAADDRWLTTRDLAQRYQSPPSTIRQWRFQGSGPRGVKIGRKVLYRLSEVLRWEKALEKAERDRETTAVAS